MPKHQNDSHVSFHLDGPTLAAIEAAAAFEERTKSDWIRMVLRRDLRERGLLPDLKTKRNGRDQ